MRSVFRRRGWRLLVVLLGGAAFVGILFFLSNRPSSSSALPSPDDEAGTHPSLGASTDAAASRTRSGTEPVGKVDAGASSSLLPLGVVALVPWGAGTEQIGRPVYKDAHGHAHAEGGEGQVRAPMSLSTDGREKLLLLDATHERILRLGPDGEVESSIPLTGLTPRDITAAADGSVLVLDSHARKSVTLLDEDGRPRGELPIAGPNVEDPEAIRAVHVAGEDVYVESLSGDYVRVGDVHGHADAEQTRPPGLPMRDGTGYLGARLLEPTQGSLHLYVLNREPAAQRFSRQLKLPMQLEGIFLVDSNQAGIIYLGVQGSPAGAPEGTHTLQLVCVDAQRGDVLGMAELPIDVPREVVMDAAALDAGGVVLNVWTERGLRVHRHDCL